MEQKAFILSTDKYSQSLADLNQMLESGTWKYVDSCPMPSAVACMGPNKGDQHVSKVVPTCLVVIERIKVDENKESLCQQK